LNLWINDLFPSGTFLHKFLSKWEDVECSFSTHLYVCWYVCPNINRFLLGYNGLKWSDQIMFNQKPQRTKPMCKQTSYHNLSTSLFLQIADIYFILISPKKKNSCWQDSMHIKKGAQQSPASQKCTCSRGSEFTTERPFFWMNNCHFWFQQWSD